MIAGLLVAMLTTAPLIDVPDLCANRMQQQFAPNTIPADLCTALEVLDRHWVRESGAIVQDRDNPSGPDTYVDLRSAGWYLLALGYAGGEYNVADPVAQFLVRTIQVTATDLRPYGSVPTHVDSSGAAITPFYQRDIAASAYVLAALRTHLSYRNEAEREAFLGDARDAVHAAGDLLANWTLGGSGEIAPAYVQAFGHDGVTPAMYFEFWMGLDAARQILESVGEEAPAHWQDRLDSLLTRIKLQLINRGGPIVLDWNLAQWFQRISGWGAAEVGAYIVNESGMPAPTGFAWDIADQLRILSAGDFQDDPLRAAQCFVALVEYAGAQAVAAAAATTP